MTYDLLEALIRNAASKAENRNEDGSINWDFVDSDCWADCALAELVGSVEYYAKFDQVADQVTAEEG